MSELLQRLAREFPGPWVEVDGTCRGMTSTGLMLLAWKSRNPDRRMPYTVVCRSGDYSQDRDVPTIDEVIRTMHAMSKAAAAFCAAMEAPHAT